MASRITWGLPSTYEAARRASVLSVSEAFTLPTGSTRRARSRRTASGARGRQGEADGVPLAGRAGGPDAATVRLDDPPGHRQPQPGAPGRGALAQPDPIEQRGQLLRAHHRGRALHGEHHAPVAR